MPLSFLARKRAAFFVDVGDLIKELVCSGLGHTDNHFSQ